MRQFPYSKVPLIPMFYGAITSLPSDAPDVDSIVWVRIYDVVEACVIVP